MLIDQSHIHLRSVCGLKNSDIHTEAGLTSPLVIDSGKSGEHHSPVNKETGQVRSGQVRSADGEIPSEPEHGNNTTCIHYTLVSGDTER